MNREISAFVERYVKEIRNNNAAIFAGAGFSKSSGYVDWKNLLRDIAEELGLNVDKEHDLVSLAQYCYNKNGNRSIINDVIFEEFKGTGNMEVHLDRKLQERRIFPAIDIYKSGTRKEDLLLSDEEKEVAFAIRKVMYKDGNIENVTENLINMLSKTKNNKEFIQVFPKNDIFKK